MRSYLSGRSEEELTKIRESQPELIRFLRTLDVTEWMELITDLVQTPASTVALFNFRFPEEEIVSASASMAGMSETTKKQMALAIDNIIAKEISKEEACGISNLLGGALFFSSALKLPVDISLLFQLIDNESISQQIRTQAASVLADRKISPALAALWMRLRPRVNSMLFLAAPLIRALSFVDPIQALDTFLKLPRETNFLQFEYPLREIFVHLPPEKKSEVKAMLMNIDERHLRTVRSVASESTFWGDLFDLSNLRGPGSFDSFAEKLTDMGKRITREIQDFMIDVLNEPAAAILSLSGRRMKRRSGYSQELVAAGYCPDFKIIIEQQEDLILRMQFFPSQQANPLEIELQDGTNSFVERLDAKNTMPEFTLPLGFESSVSVLLKNVST